jgi:hypothetical protein
MKPIETIADIVFDIILNGEYYRRANGVLIEITEKTQIVHFHKKEDVFQAILTLHTMLMDCELEEEFDRWLEN